MSNVNEKITTYGDLKESGIFDFMDAFTIFVIDKFDNVFEYGCSNDPDEHFFELVQTGTNEEYKDIKGIILNDKTTLDCKIKKISYNQNAQCIGIYIELVDTEINIYTKDYI